MEERQRGILLEEENTIAQSSMNDAQSICKEKEWRPLRIDSLREYEVCIRFLSIGCVISVGCKQVPFSTVEDGMKALADYINNPYETKKVWEERFSKQI